MFGKCKTSGIYREKEIVIVTCQECGKPRLLQHRSHWGDNIPMVDCRLCAQRKRRGNSNPVRKLKDFDDMLDTLEIVKSFFTPDTPLMVKTPVNAMLKAYR